MKYIFCSNMYIDPERDVKLSKSPNPISGHKYQENMLKGLIQNNVPVRVINTQRISPYPKYPLIHVRKSPYQFNGSTIGINIGFINLPVISYITKMIHVYSSLKRSIDRKANNMILVYNSELVTCLSALIVRFFNHNCMVCNAIGDLSGKYGIVHKNSLKDRAVNYIRKFCDHIGRKCDCYILVTDHMAKALGIQNRPYCVIEALYEVDDKENVDRENKINSEMFTSEKKVFYAGALDIKYGIEHLLNSFSMIDDDNYRLLIAGSGNGKQKVLEYARRDRRIKYLGFLSPNEVRQYQAQATVLVNPRLPDENYILYSFPSKTVEYLASGKPYISHRLPCYPDEYACCIEYVEDLSDSALAEKIVSISEMSLAEREELGKRGREFVQGQKSPVVQMKKLIKMIEMNWKGIL